MNKTYLIFILTSPYFFIACTEYNKTDVKVVKSHLLQEYENFDSLLLGDIRQIEYKKDAIKFSESSYLDIFSLNKEFKLTGKLIGERGKGPGENPFLEQFKSIGDSLFIKNDMLKKIDLFYQNEYMKSFKIDNANFIGGMNFGVAKGKFFFAAKDVDHLFIGQNINEDSTYFYGENVSNNRLATHSYLLTLEDNVIYVAKGDPVINMFSISDQGVLDSYEYSRIDYVSDLMNVNGISVGSQSLPSYYNYWQDATIDQNTLYLLTYSYSHEDGSVDCNKILYFNIKNNRFSSPSIIELDEGYYKTFDIEGDKILAFDYSSSKLKHFSF